MHSIDALLHRLHLISCSIWTSPRKVPPLTFSWSSAPFLCCFSHISFYLLPCLCYTTPCCWFLTYDSQSSPRQLWSAYPHPGQQKNRVPFFVFSIIHPHFSTLLFLCAQLLSRALLFANPWTVANQAPLSMEFFQARMLEWVVIYSSRGSSQPRDQTCVSCIGRQILFHCTTWEALSYSYQSQYPTPIFFPNFLTLSSLSLSLLLLSYKSL